MLVSAAVLVGCGIFFAFQDLGKADQYASVGSFFLALLTAVGSVLTLARSKSDKAADNEGVENQPNGRSGTRNFALFNEVVHIGDGSTTNIVKTVGRPSEKRGRRNS
jgi:hypothetical protein